MVTIYSTIRSTPQLLLPDSIFLFPFGINKISLHVIFLIIGLWAVPVSADDECLSCHRSSPPLGQKSASPVDSVQFQNSVHSSLLCNDCHLVDAKKPHVETPSVNCGECHAEAFENYSKSPHMRNGDKTDRLPTCVTCHGNHGIRGIEDPFSWTFHKNSIKICTSCHTDSDLNAQTDQIPIPSMIKAYEKSVHGLALIEKGILDAPSCIDCHGSHSFLPADNPESPVYKSSVANTCGKCHEEIVEQYNLSVHGRTLMQGVSESPTCTNCHGEHNILTHLDPESRVYATNISTTCSECHGSEAIVGKYGLKADRVETFKESFHGVAIEFGETRVANCASCHGVHDIYPQSDPNSLIHTDNIVKTCGNCHEGLPADFARGTIHLSSSDKDGGGAFYVRRFYYWFIPIIIFGFIIYRVLEYNRRSRRAR